MTLRDLPLDELLDEMDRGFAHKAKAEIRRRFAALEAERDAEVAERDLARSHMNGWRDRAKAAEARVAELERENASLVEGRDWEQLTRETAEAEVARLQEALEEPWAYLRREAFIYGLSDEANEKIRACDPARAALGEEKA